MADKESTNNHDSKSDSILNEAMLMTSTDNVSFETTDSISQNSSFYSTRHHSISRQNCIANSTDNLPAKSSKQSRHFYSLSEKPKKLLKRDKGLASSKRFTDDSIVNKDMKISSEEDNFVPTKEKLTTNSLEESNIWPALTILDQSLSECDANTSKENHEIFEKLYERYNCSPRSFTEHLITILEETRTDILEKCNDSSASPALAKLLNNAKGNGKILDDESAPENFISSSTKNEESTNLTKFSTITPDSLDESSHEFDINSTRYISLETLNPTRSKILHVTHEKTPKILINDKVIENISAASSPAGSSPIIFIKKTYRKTPKIIINPATPQNMRIASINFQSPRENNNNDDEYITAGSEYESDFEATLVDETSTSRNETVNMSKVFFHHNEWMKTYEKMSKPSVNFKSPSKIYERKLKISNHTNKLEKGWLDELGKKRQKCFDMVDQMMKKKSPRSEKSENYSSSPRYKREKQFLNILTACSDYFTYMTARDEIEKKSNKIKNPRSPIMKSPLNSKRKCITNSRCIHNVTKRMSRKSLEMKGTWNKLPGSTSTNSSRKSISKKRRGATPEIDRSSIRSVRELRMVYSPRPTIRANPGTKIPLPMQPTWNSYIPQSSVKSAIFKASNAARELNVGGAQATKNFKHVKSPIREYIRREYKKPILLDAL